MAHTYKHKLKGKFNNLLMPKGKIQTDLTFSELAKFYPKKMQLTWVRHNFEVGYFRNLRNIKKLKIIKKDENKY